MKTTEVTVMVAILLFSATAAFSAPSGPGFENTACSEMSLREIKAPDDFLIVYRSGDSNGSMPGRRTQIEVNANGTVKYFDGFRKGGSPHLPLKQREISREKVARIYAKVLGCEFFSLNEHYTNSRIFGCWSSYIFVRASGRSHGVSMSNTSVKRFASILKILHEETGI